MKKKLWYKINNIALSIPKINKFVFILNYGKVNIKNNQQYKWFKPNNLNHLQSIRIKYAKR